MIEISRYHKDLSQKWNDFVKESKNGLFLFDRRFMDYHSDRFSDHSLVFCEENSIIALFPANEKEDTIYSHQGLTFGSLVMSKKIRISQVLEIFEQIKNYYRQQGFKKIIYKAIPSVFASYPAQEDLYALYRNDAKLIRRDISSVVEISNKLSFNRSKRSNVNKLAKNNYEVSESIDFKGYWKLLTDVLKKYETKPVHTLDEISLLKERFENEIKLFVVKENDIIISGTIIFDYGNVVHTQYLATSERGAELDGLAFINHHLINGIYADRKYFSFGISTENNGLFLNEGLIDQKERMGGRGIVLDHYEISL